MSVLPREKGNKRKDKKKGEENNRRGEEGEEKKKKRKEKWKCRPAFLVEGAVGHPLTRHDWECRVAL